jgi:hypothetical protein
VIGKGILPPLLFHKWFFVSFYKNGKKFIYEDSKNTGLVSTSGQIKRTIPLSCTFMESRE